MIHQLPLTISAAFEFEYITTVPGERAPHVADHPTSYFGPKPSTDSGITIRRARLMPHADDAVPVSNEKFENDVLFNTHSLAGKTFGRGYDGLITLAKMYGHVWKTFDLQNALEGLRYTDNPDIILPINYPERLESPRRHVLRDVFQFYKFERLHFLEDNLDWIITFDSSETRLVYFPINEYTRYPVVKLYSTRPDKILAVQFKV